ncbi:MAG TPA: FprA family A-type flavoprotein [Methanoregulaceae archaeon]|nr:FprA family A-type flavoprotein [Methanoregulaceae archaeon]
MIPLPHGTSYNAYIVKGTEKTVLIDTVDPTKEFDLVCNLVRLGISAIDYIIVNHAEQDHSGSLPMILEIFPNAKAVTNDKCKEILQEHFDIDDDRFLVIKDREILSLGNKSLEFILAPWVHWPETMLTYLREDRILFSCDLFGSHSAASDLFVKDFNQLYPLAKRYYAEIMMPFRSSIRGHIEKISGLAIDYIAPSHGPVYNKPSDIVDAYRDWTSDLVKNEVVIAYVSMHGSTQKMVDYFTGALIDRGVTVKPYNLTVTDTGELATAIVDAATIVLATPTVLFGPHPLAVYVTYLTNILRPKARFMSVICSFGWGGKAPDMMQEMLTHLKPEFIDPVVVKGAPDEEAFRALDALADAVANRHKGIGIL